MIQDFDPLYATVALLLLSFVLFALGVPISFSLGGTAVLFLILFFTPAQWYQVVLTMYGTTMSLVLIAVPLFIFMGSILSYTNMGEDLYDTIYKWAGPVRGVLASGTEVVGAAFAAMCGSAAATIASMGQIAMPEMLKRGYHPRLAVGSVATGGLLGIIIPPTVPGVIFATASNVPVGDIYFGLFIPGFGLAACYIAYISIRCYLQPGYGPALPLSERGTWKSKFIALKGVVLPLLIIFAVLGGIYAGVMTPTEAAGIGAFLVLIVAVARKRMNLSRLFNTLTSTFKLTTMLVWIIICVSAFVNVFNGLGGSKLVANASQTIAQHYGGMTVVIIMLLTIMVAGMFMDDLAVILLLGPIYVPVVKSLGFDPLWFGVLFLVLMQTAWVSPPYGFALFITRAITPKEIPTSDIWRAMFPFIGCQMVVLVLVLLVPAVCQWLPHVVLGS